MGYSDIFYDKEEKHYAPNQQKFKNFIETFLQETRIDISDVLRVQGIEENDYVSKFFF